MVYECDWTSLQKEKSTSGRNGWPATASSDTKSDTIVVDGMLSGTRILPTSSSFRFFARPFYVNKISLKLDWLTFLGVENIHDRVDALTT